MFPPVLKKWNQLLPRLILQQDRILTESSSYSFIRFNGKIKHVELRNVERDVVLKRRTKIYEKE